MLQVASALEGYAIEASDGLIGTVSDFLFDDRTWKIRWLVVDTGNWLAGRLVLIHPSAIGQPDYLRRVLHVALTKARVEASPDAAEHQPVSRQMEFNLYQYYGWDPARGSSFFGADATTSAMLPSPMFTGSAEGDRENKDPHLRGITEVTGYGIHATDGMIGHVENFLLEDDNWAIRYLVVDTKDWWFGQHVLISPYAVRGINLARCEVTLDLSRVRVKSSPPWTPLDLIDQAYEKRLHSHYAWPGYGW